MTGAAIHPIRFFGRLLLALMGLAALGGGASASAATLHIDRSLCHAASGVGASHASLADRPFSCTGEPNGYQHGSLSLRPAPTRPPGPPPREPGTASGGAR